MKNTAFIIDEKAKLLALDYLHTEGKLLSVLMEMREQKIFTELNYSGVFDYCERRLGFSRAQSYYFKSVAEASANVPELKNAVVQGEITLSVARRIAPVVTSENLSDWIKKTKTLDQTELERAVTEVNPKARPKERIRPMAKNISELKVPVDNETEENLSVLKEILSQKLGKPATLSDVVAWAAKVTREKFDPVKKAIRSEFRTVSSGNRKTSIPKPGRHAIAASIRHEVVRKTGMQCDYKSSDGRRCLQKRWLQFHHLIPVANGGLNTAQNLRLLCNQHHTAIHSH